jgi:hypothetical protein
MQIGDVEWSFRILWNIDKNRVEKAVRSIEVLIPRFPASMSKKRLKSLMSVGQPWSVRRAAHIAQSPVVFRVREHNVERHDFLLMELLEDKRTKTTIGSS